MKVLLSVMFFFLIYVQGAYALGSKLFISGNNKAFDVTDIDSALQEIAKKDNKKNILFYIHGRGKHPIKGLEYLPDMEKRYNIKVLMFSWPSWSSYLERPVGNAELAARELDIALKSLQRFRLDYPRFFKKRKISFLSHSMGNIVTKTYMQAFHKKGVYKTDFFETFVLNAPDVSLSGHWKWVEKIDFSPNIYSTYNRGDTIMLGSKAIDLIHFKIFSGPRLGKTLKYGFIKAKLAKNVFYLDFSKLTKGGHSHHRSASKDSPYLNKVFKYLTNGIKLPFDRSVGVKAVKKRIVVFAK